MRGRIFLVVSTTRAIVTDSHVLRWRKRLNINNYQSVSSSYIIFVTNNCSFFSICFTLSLEPARGLSPSTSSPSPLPTPVTSSSTDSPLSSSITPSLFHYRLKACVSQILPTLDFLPPSRLTPRTVSCELYIGWQWRYFFISNLCQLFSRHDVGQALRNVCYCDTTFLVKDNDNTDIFLNQMIQFYSNNATKSSPLKFSFPTT